MFKFLTLKVINRNQKANQEQEKVQNPVSRVHLAAQRSHKVTEGNTRTPERTDNRQVRAGATINQQVRETVEEP